MEHQDNLFDQFKKAADSSETKEFPGMEKVWSRVDAKLDTQVYQAQKNTNMSWRKFAVAASIVVGTVFAYQFLKEEKNIQSPQNTIVVNDSIANKIINDTTSAIVSSENEVIIDKKEADKIIEEQLKNPNQVVVNEVSSVGTTITEEPKLSATPMVASTKNKAEEKTLLKERSYESVGATYDQAEITENKQETVSKKQSIRKAAPLVVVDGKATNKKVADIQNSDDLETIVELKNPLYIINGIEYTEKEVFGPNPTSPYYPLNKQAIESITIYQDEEAIELYGEKGEHGVVVVKTKNGKPIKPTR